MRDGIMLRADVYRPAGARPGPALLLRTPYDRSVSMIPPSGIDPERAVDAGYVVVCQDVRGQYRSDGAFYTFAAEAADGYDTVEWVAAQPWCDGAVGMVGPLLQRDLSVARCLGAASAPASDLPGRHRQRLLSRLGLPGRRVPARLQPVLDVDDEQPSQPRRPEARRPFPPPPAAHGAAAGPGVEPLLLRLARPPDRRRRSGARSRSTSATPGSRYRPSTSAAGTTSSSAARSRTSPACAREGGSEDARTGQRLLVGPWAHGSTYGLFPDHSFEPLQAGRRDRFHRGAAALLRPASARRGKRRTISRRSDSS